MPVSKMEDMAGDVPASGAYEQDGEVLCWNATIKSGGMTMYSVPNRPMHDHRYIQ